MGEEVLGVIAFLNVVNATCIIVDLIIKVSRRSPGFSWESTEG